MRLGYRPGRETKNGAEQSFNEAEAHAPRILSPQDIKTRLGAELQ